jgi:hypothetical protein
MTAIEVERLALQIGPVVESARVVSRVDLLQDGDHVGVAIPEADDLEDAAVDVEDVDPILSDA